MREQLTLLTGGKGFIGRYALKALADGGFRTTVVELEADNFKANDAEANDLRVVGCDLALAPPDLKGQQFDLVIHLAGMVHKLPSSTRNRQQFHAVNVRGTANLLAGLERLQQLPEALVLASTVAVYGRERGEDLAEDTPVRATDSYGQSKRKAEDLVLEWGRHHGVRISVLRLPLVAGANAPGNLGAMVSALRRGRYLGVGRGDARRSMVLAEDVAKVIPKLAETGGVYHLTDGHHPSIRALEDSLSRAMNRNPPPRLPMWAAKALARTGDALRAVGASPPFTSATLGKMTSSLTFSDHRARQVLGWRPRRVVDHAAEIVT